LQLRLINSTLVPCGDLKLTVRSPIHGCVISSPVRFTSDIAEMPLIFSVEVTTPGEPPPKSGIAFGTSSDAADTWHTGVLVGVAVNVAVGTGLPQALPMLSATSSTYQPPAATVASVPSLKRSITL
jgi:hypothetical protein